MLPPAVCTSTGTEMAYSLSSTTKRTGSFRLQAVFSASQNSPSEVVPSPAVQTTISSSAKVPRWRAQLRLARRPETRLGGAHGLQELRPRRRGGRDDVEAGVPVVAWHLAAAAGRIGLGAHPLQQLLHGRHPERQRQGAVPVVEVEPVRPRPHQVRQRDLHRLVARARDQEEDLALPVQLRLAVVDGAGRDHGPVPGEQFFGARYAGFEVGAEIVFLCGHALPEVRRGVGENAADYTDWARPRARRPVPPGSARAPGRPSPGRRTPRRAGPAVPPWRAARRPPGPRGHRRRRAGSDGSAGAPGRACPGRAPGVPPA